MLALWWECGIGGSYVCHMWSCLQVCYWVYRLLGWEWVLPCNMLDLFQGLVSSGSRSRARLSFTLVWHVTMWAIYKTWNDLIFSSIAWEVEKLVDKIQFQSQNWLCVKHPSYTFVVHMCVDQVKIGLGDQNYHRVKT